MTTGFVLETRGELHIDNRPTRQRKHDEEDARQDQVGWMVEALPGFLSSSLAHGLNCRLRLCVKMCSIENVIASTPPSDAPDSMAPCIRSCVPKESPPVAETRDPRSVFSPKSNAQRGGLALRIFFKNRA